MFSTNTCFFKPLMLVFGLFWECLLFGVFIVIASDATAKEQIANPEIRRIGIVLDLAPSGDPGVMPAWRAELAQLGYISGHNLEVLERWTNGNQSLLPKLMAEMVEANVNVIVTNGTPGALAAKAASNRVPIVAIGVADPVRAQLVASHAHPAGNLTAISMGFAPEFSGKWLEILQECISQLTTVAVFANPNNPMHSFLVKDVQAVAVKRGLQSRTIEVSAIAGVEDAFAQARREAQAAIIFGDAATVPDQRKVTALAAKYRTPTIYGVRSFVDQGGLMSYAPDVRAMGRRAAQLVDMIFKGAKPANIPVEEPTKFELVLNLKTAKALGITIPESILLRADEVIR
jgi:putative ABC transport system substrate-binding protein